MQKAASDIEMTTDTAVPQITPTPGAAGDSSLVTNHSSLSAYRVPLSNTWWLRNRRYTRFMLREFTAVPITLWLLSLLIVLARVRAGAGSGAESPLGSPAYVVFSVICLIFALYHSWTWLGISGLILRIPLGERDLPPRLVTAANYALWAVASIVIGAALIFLWR